MNKFLGNLTSLIKLSMQEKKVYSYIVFTKDLLVLLDIFWVENLIWGYVKKDAMVKVYFKYRKNKPIIQSIKRYNICLKFYSLYNLIQQYPESTFIIKTKIGYKTHIDCLKLRCGGILVLKIN